MWCVSGLYERETIEDLILTKQYKGNLLILYNINWFTEVYVIWCILIKLNWICYTIKGAIQNCYRTLNLEYEEGKSQTADCLPAKVRAEQNKTTKLWGEGNPNVGKLGKRGKRGKRGSLIGSMHRLALHLNNKTSALPPRENNAKEAACRGRVAEWSKGWLAPRVLILSCPSPPVEDWPGQGLPTVALIKDLRNFSKETLGVPRWTNTGFFPSVWPCFKADWDGRCWFAQGQLWFQN